MQEIYAFGSLPKFYPYIAVSNLLNISIAVCREGVSYCTCHHLEVDYMLAKALR